MTLVKGQVHQRSLSLFSSLFHCKWMAYYLNGFIDRATNYQLYVYDLTNFKILRVAFYPKSKVNTVQGQKRPYLMAYKSVNIHRWNLRVGSKHLHWNYTILSYTNIIFPLNKLECAVTKPSFGRFLPALSQCQHIWVQYWEHVAINWPVLTHIP